MDPSQYARELRQIAVIQNELENISNVSKKQKIQAAIDNMASFNNATSQLVEEITSHKVVVVEEFLKLLNHELRTPLVPILAYSEMLSSEKFGPLSDEQKKKVETIVSNAQILQNKIEVLINKHEFTNVTDIVTTHELYELTQKNLLLQKINSLLSKQITDDDKTIQSLQESFAQSEHKQKDLEQEEVLIEETLKLNEQRILRLKKKHGVILVSIAIAVSIISVIGLQYIAYLEGREYEVPNIGITPSNYVIQNLQGDVVDTWTAWNIESGRTIHVHIVNTANLPQNMLDSVKDAILSTKGVSIDDSLTGKGPKGTSSVYYVGWEGAAEAAYSEPTKQYIPQTFDVNGSPEAVGDVEIILTNDISPDGFSGYTKSLVDGNQILKTKITIYKANKLDAAQLEAIMRHEFGHALGLGHSTASEDLMHPVLPDYPYISSCDIETLHKLYDGDKNSKVICSK